MPAVGFALMTKLLMIALERQGARFEASPLDVLIACDPACAGDALRRAAALRAEGRSVAMIYRVDRESLLRHLDAGDAREGLLFTPAGTERIAKEVTR